jgi:alpha-galactosidase
VELRRRRIRVRPTDAPAAVVLADQPGPQAVAGVEVTWSEPRPGELAWSVTNPGAEDIALDAVALVWDAGAPGPEPRMFSQGYQSWSPTRTLRLGIDEDPSRDPRPLALVRAAFHADPGVCAPGELRSEQVTVLALADREPHLVGFLGGATHAGTIRARIAGDTVEVSAEAWLGGAVLRAGASRALHSVIVVSGEEPSRLLEHWATRVGANESARTAAPYLVGWCSWYHYFHDVTAHDIESNLTLADAWPFDVFQLDDGYQRTIGDWLHPNEKFPGGVAAVADSIVASGRTAGIWLAPFLVAPDAQITTESPEWLARAPAGDGFAIGMYHDVWGGVMWEFDVTDAAVIDHLECTARSLVEIGYRYLKLDFTFSAAMPGRFRDPTRTPAERVRAGYEAIRRGAGDDVFILGCGAPVGALVGVVDGMRIGADVAPWWSAPADAEEQQPAYELTTPATQHAFVNTCNRSFMHRKLWLNDPDCVMLRASDTRLSVPAAETWARTVGCSGGLALVSDDLALLGPDARALLDEVVAVGRAADAAAATGPSPPRSVGLLDPAGPLGLEGPMGAIRVDFASGEETVASRAIRSHH